MQIPMERCLNCSQYFDVRNNSTANNTLHMLFNTCGGDHLGKFLEMELLVKACAYAENLKR